MSKSKGAKPARVADPLTKVKGASITKPAKSVKEKSRELAKKISEKKDIKKKFKEPTPEETSSEGEGSESFASESDSVSESESESDVETKPAVNGKTNGFKPAGKAEGSDEAESDSESESEGSDSGVEATKLAATRAKAWIAAPDGHESDTGASDDGSTAAEDDSDANSDEESEDEELTNSAVMGAHLPKDDQNEEQDEDESEDSSGESESDGGKPAEAAPQANSAAKRAEPESEDESAQDSNDESSDDGEDSDDSDSSEESKVEEKPKTTKRKAEGEAPAAAKKAKVEVVDPAKKTLFVGNLSWNVTEDWLQQEFEEFGTVEGCRLVTERGTGRSKGYGYVDFENALDAAKAHKAKAGAELDGRPMNIDFANARPSNEQRQEDRRKSYADSVSEPTDTLFIGNLSFDADQESVTNLFQPQGTILGVRLPTDQNTGAPRGYGYVTFSSVEEAQAALDAMQGGYLNGRPMRLDFSQPRQNSGGQRGGFSGRGRGGARGGFSAQGGRGGFGDRGGRGGGRGGRGAARGTSSTNRGGFNDFKGQKVSFD